MGFVADLCALLAGENLSSPSKKKWESTYDLVASALGIDASDVYCTYMGKATQAQVRLGKQIRGTIPYRIALGFGGDGRRESSSYETHSRKALSDFPTLEAVVLFFEQGAPGSGAWLPERVFARRGATIVSTIASWNPGMEIEVVESSDAGQRALASATPGSSPEFSGSVEQLGMTASIFHLLRKSRNVVLKGVPGVGKTYLCRVIVENWAGGMDRRLAQHQVLVLHASSSYEDLIEGLRPGIAIEGASFLAPEAPEQSDFSPTLGRVASFVRAAALTPEEDYLLILDEINRTNLSAAFGEFLLLIEASKRSTWQEDHWESPIDGRVALTYSGRDFFVPDNLYVVATMNSSDRSVSPMDRAMARRFEEVHIPPLDSFELQQMLSTSDPAALSAFEDCVGIWQCLNDEVLLPFIGPDAVVGHASLIAVAESLNQGGSGSQEAADFLEFSLLPQVIKVLSEYGHEDLLLPGAGRGERAEEAAGLLATTLAYYGLEVSLQGMGLGRRVVVSRV